MYGQIWQVYDKLVRSEPHAFEVGKFPDMTCGTYNILIGHRSEIVGYKLSKVKDARPDRWTSVGYANQLARY